MKPLPTSLIFTLLLSGFAIAEPIPTEPTPAERRIAEAQRAVERLGDQSRPYVDLALAYARRARETADTSYYEKAHAALDQAETASPGDFAARRVRAWTLLGQHEFQQALELARKLNKEAPDDVLVYGFLADALVELGRYDEAVEAVQWMLDLRPGNVPALTRAAYLRELHGYGEGALDFLWKAYERTSPAEREDRAWVLVQIAHVERQRENLDAAEEAVTAALELFPEYHYALAELGRILLDRGQPAAAVDALERRYRAAPHPENLYELATALEAAGRTEEAAEAFARFESDAAAESDSWDNSNRELIERYAESGRLEEAVALAEREMERRQDVFTRAAYGWALYQAGRTEDAREQFTVAREMRVLDGKIRRRAEVVFSGS